MGVGTRYFLMIYETYLVLFQGTNSNEVSRVLVEGLDVSPGAVNELGLVVIDDTAYVELNGQYVATFDVSGHIVAGDISFWSLGRPDRYTDFTIWSLHD